MDDVYQLTDDEVAPEPGLDQLRKSVMDRYPETMNRLAESEKPASIDWQSVQLARDLCSQQGHDPDLRVLDVKNANRGPLGSTAVHQTVPAWTLYLEAAQNVKGALNG